MMNIIDDNTYLFVDGTSINYLIKNNQCRFDYEKLLVILGKYCHIYKTMYYSIAPIGVQSDNFVKHLQYLSYSTHMFYLQADRSISPSDLRAQMAVTMATHIGLCMQKVQQIILITSDPLLSNAAACFRNNGGRVCIINCRTNFEQIFRKNSDCYLDIEPFLHDCFTSKDQAGLTEDVDDICIS